MKGKFYDSYTPEAVNESVQMYLKGCEFQTKFGRFNKIVGAGFPYSDPDAVYKYELKVVVDTIDTGNTAASALLGTMAFGFNDKLFNLIYRYLFLETACGYDIRLKPIKK